MSLNDHSQINPLSVLDIYSKNQGNELIKGIEKRYSLENDMIRAVSQGNYKLLCGMLSVDVFIGNVEHRTDDEVRNLKNYMIIFNSLLRKGAEVGNVHPFYIHGLSSQFAKKIEQSSSVKEIEVLWKEMSYSYCKLVKTHAAKGYSPLVQNIVMLIDADLSENLSLSAFAERFNINPSYLSSLFKKDTGYTLTEYVNSKRIEKAKFLLESTSQQIQTVSDVCGIYDVNYFVKIFKKFTGMTPGQYRENIRNKKE